MKRLKHLIQHYIDWIIYTWVNFQYNSWLYFGGERTERGFKFLSDSILRNRKLISELRAKNHELERRLWDLENHTMDEHLEKLHETFDSIHAKVDQLKKTSTDNDNQVQEQTNVN